MIAQLRNTEMLDHVFTDAIGAIRDAFETALLERQAFEERFNVDVLLGDTTWETTYCLPGEGEDPRVQVDITMVWPTWAQTAYRSWYIGEDIDDPPRISIELAFRVQHLAVRPDPAALLSTFPDRSSDIGSDPLRRDTTTLELIHDFNITEQGWAIETTFVGDYELPESALADGSEIDEHLGGLGVWIASLLVKLGDLDVEYLARDD